MLLMHVSLMAAMPYRQTHTLQVECINSKSKSDPKAVQAETPHPDSIMTATFKALMLVVEAGAITTHRTSLPGSDRLADVDCLSSHAACSCPAPTLTAR